jgi:ABC-type cobalamin/Fe3+-siderophores transport system ATPase subunit
MHELRQPTSGAIVEIENLSRKFGSRTALDGVSLTIPKGTVFGLVGRNGAGKTTLIRHVLGLLRAEQGSVSVFGLEPVANPVAVLSRVGYLSEVNELPEWMRIDELIAFTRAFYPTWDQSYADSLRQQFELEPQQIVGERIDEVGIDGPLEDRESVPVDALLVFLHRVGIEHRGATLAARNREPRCAGPLSVAPHGT